MKQELIHITIPPTNPEEMPRDCRMSIDLYQNARQTMGELRDLMRCLGISWDFIQHEIDRANHPKSAIDKAMDAMDEYSTGPGKSLRNLPSNIW